MTRWQGDKVTSTELDAEPENHTDRLDSRRCTHGNLLHQTERLRDAGTPAQAETCHDARPVGSGPGQRAIEYGA